MQSDSHDHDSSKTANKNLNSHHAGDEVHICNAGATVELRPCPNEHRQYIYRSSIVKLDRPASLKEDEAPAPTTDKNPPDDPYRDGIVITVIYEHTLKELGLGKGRHLYSTTLVPGEEVEIEIFRSAKRTDDLSRDYSTEETYNQEFSRVLQDDWTRRDVSNFKISGGVTASGIIKLIKIEASVQPEYSTSTDEFHRSFSEMTTKAAAKTDRRFDMHVGVKSELFESTRSTRRLRNLNQCQTVTYHYFQLARLFEMTLSVVRIRFDTVDEKLKVSSLFRRKLDYVGVDYEVEPFRPYKALPETAGKGPGPDQLPPTSIGGGGQQPGQVAPPSWPTPQPNNPPPGRATVRSEEERDLSDSEIISSVTAALRTPPREAPELARTVWHPYYIHQHARELTLAQLAKQLKLEGAPLAQFNKAVTDLLNGLNLEEGKLAKSTDGTEVKQQFCIATNSVYADATTGACAACDTHSVHMQRLEEQKLALEVQQLKHSVSAFAPVMGYVQSASGGVGGAVVTLYGSGGNVIARDETDSSGFYAIPAKGLLSEGEEYRARVTTIPKPYSNVTEPPEFTWKGKQIPVYFTLS